MSNIKQPVLGCMADHFTGATDLANNRVRSGLRTVQSIGVPADAGVRQLVVACGETTGSVVQALGVQQMTIGPQIDPGVPWTAVASTFCPGQTLHLALKSGNFGSTDFFTKAFAMLAVVR